MYTLEQVRTQVTNLLAETSTAFWSSDERDQAINNAQRYVAGRIGGVPSSISDTVDNTTPYINLTGYEVLDHWPRQVEDRTNGGSLVPTTLHIIDRMDPAWSTREGTPRWVGWDSSRYRLYAIPKPTLAMGNITIEAAFRTMPADMTADDDELFGGFEAAERYQNPMIHYAVGLALLKQHYDDDANRFFELAVTELNAFDPPAQQAPA